VQLSGASLTTHLLTDEDFLYTANVGDTKSVLVQIDKQHHTIEEENKKPCEKAWELT
jgi:serine/threonine protein phosphatase PrpC